MKDYGIHYKHLLIIPMLLSFPVGSSRSKAVFSPFKNLEERNIDHLMNVGKALAEMCADTRLMISAAECCRSFMVS